MRILCLFIFIFLCDLQVFPQITFEKTFGTIDDDEGTAVEVCHDGTYILLGAVDNLYSGKPDIYLARINQYGDTIWTRTFGGVYDYDVPGDVQQSSDLGFIITGHTYSNDTSMPFLLKYDETGQFMWFKKYGMEIPDGYGYVVVETPDSGYMICGRRDYYNTDWYPQPFMLETNQDGDCIWYKIFTFAPYSIYEVIDMCLSPENDYILCGEFEDLLISTIEHALLFKVGSGMNVYWTKVYGPSDSTTYAMDVELTDDGGYLLCGTIYEGEIILPGKDFNIYLVKTNSSGEQEWTRSIGTDDYAEHGNCSDKTLDGGYIIGGSIDSEMDYKDIWLVKTDGNGDTLWTQRYGGYYSEGLTDICATSDGGFLFCGYTDSYGLGGSDIYLVKTDENGLLTRINEKQDILSEVKVAPAAGDGIFHLRNCPDDLTYMIYDLNARIILKNKPVTCSDEKVDISNVAPGVYILHLQSSTCARSIKIIKTQ